MTDRTTGRTSPKTWGPFSGSQLTIIIVALVLALVPGALFAAKNFQKVVVIDHKTGKKARVGRDGVDVYDKQGARHLSPKNFFNFVETNVDNNCTAVFTAPARKAMIVTTLVLNNYQVDSPGSGTAVFLYVGDVCNSASTVLVVNPGDIGPTVVPLQTGIVVPAGATLRAREGNSIQTEIYGTGYKVPKSWAPNSLPKLAGMSVSSAQQP